MKIKIISLEDEKAIRFDNISSKLEVLDNNNFKNKVKYYKVEKNIVEVYYLTEKEDINNYNLNSNSDRILVLVKSLNEKNIEIIKKIESNYNIIVAIGEVNILNEKYLFINGMWRDHITFYKVNE